MTTKNPRKRQGSALGKGLDALIRKDYLDAENENLTEEIDDKVEKDESRTVDVDTKIDETKTIREKSSSTDTTDLSVSQAPNFDDKIVEDVLLEVYKNPRISLWSARSAAVLRFLKKTKPEFSISNEASLLIEAAVKDRHPDIWKIFEEKGL